MVSPGQILFLGGIFFFLGIAGIVSCGDPERNNLLGRAAKLLRKDLPATISFALASTGLSFLETGARRIFECCFLRRNPIVAIGYIILVWGGFVLFVMIGYPKFPNPYVLEWHKPVGYFVMGLCVISFILAAFSDPGIVTADNVDTYLEVYANDGVVYKGGRKCETCGFEKPARSKHDKSLGKCVAKFDHYCIWLHNAVGERNYRWFLLFLGSHCWMLLYCAWAVSMHFRHQIESKQLLSQTYRHRASGKVIKGSWAVVFRYFMHTEQELMMILVLCAVMGIVVLFFLLYHVYLASHNLTTNETIKIGYLQWAREDARQRRDRRLEMRADAGAHLVEAEEKLKKLEEEVATDGGGEAAAVAETDAGGDGAGTASPQQRVDAMRGIVERLKGMIGAPQEPLPPKPHVLWSDSLASNWRDVVWPRFWYAARNPSIRWAGPLRSRTEVERSAGTNDTAKDAAPTGGGDVRGASSKGRPAGGQRGGARQRRTAGGKSGRRGRKG